VDLEDDRYAVRIINLKSLVPLPEEAIRHACKECGTVLNVVERIGPLSDVLILLFHERSTQTIAQVTSEGRLTATEPS
jgi:transketolase C-terminal domain/subunit